MAFVDKLCIHQTDEVLKNAGIESLAGFIKHADNILVLWSTRYFTRLWCVYELAAWAHLGKDLKSSVHFVPVALAKGVFILNVGLFVFYLSYKFNYVMNPSTYYVYLATSICMIFSCLIGTVHSLRHLMRDLRRLEVQLTTFSVRDAQCFCCTNDHLLPGKGTPLSCDRKLVYNTLQLWFASEGESMPEMSEAHLDAFDRYIRTEFAPRVLRTVGGGRLPYSYTLIIGIPFVWYVLDQIVTFDGFDVDIIVRMLAEHTVFFLCVLPISAFVVFQGAARLDKHVGAVEGVGLSILLSICSSLVLLAIFVSLWRVLVFASQLSSFTPFLAVICTYVLLTVVCFRRHGCKE